MLHKVLSLFRHRTIYYTNISFYTPFILRVAVILFFRFILIIHERMLMPHEFQCLITGLLI